jgi:hypothetical protein
LPVYLMEKEALPLLVDLKRKRKAKEKDIEFLTL